MKISIEQEEAIELCAQLDKRIVCVTGEAGTGKTTVMGRAIAAVEDFGLCALCAPTGRAAKRIEEATGYKAKTIHRLLGYGQPDENDDENAVQFVKYNRDNPMPYDVIFVDEASMIGDDLHRNLIDAMKPGASVRFFGDVNQLPPVKGRSQFAKMLEKFPSVTLTTNFRSDDGIVSAAREINRGHVPMNNDKFTLLNQSSDRLLTTLMEMIDNSYGTDKCQIISTTKKGKFGTTALNAMIQRLYRDTSEQYFHLDYKDEDPPIDIRLYRGDKIIWTKNDYRLNIMNGTLGYVTDFDLDSGEIVLEIEGKDKHIPARISSFDQYGRDIFAYDPRKYIELAYVITTHKSQGSEFERVIFIMLKNFVLSRQNFYTAVTRAREQCAVLAGTGAMAAGLRKQLT